MMSKRALLPLGFMLILGASVFVIGVKFQDQRTPLARLSEERAVYHALLTQESVSDGIYPIVEYTTLGDLKKCTASDCMQFIMKGLSAIQRGTVVDFQRHNQQSYPVREFLSPASAFEVRLVNPSQNGDLQWWLSFSRIGFNSSLDQALVVVEKYAVCTNNVCEFGSGNFVLLQLVSEEWIIQEYLEIWHMHPT